MLGLNKLIGGLYERARRENEEDERTIMDVGLLGLEVDLIRSQQPRMPILINKNQYGGYK